MFFQIEDFTCGPVALMNLEAWLGGMPDFREYFYKCKTTEEGTEDEHFDSALYKLKEKYGFRVEEIGSMTLNSLSSYLKFECNSVLMCHLDSSDEPHWSFWFHADEDTYYGKNIEYLTIAPCVDRDTMNDYLRKGPKQERRIFLINSSNHSPIAQLMNFPAELTRKSGKSLIFRPSKNYARIPLTKQQVNKLNKLD
jgi:hypothetical protein